LAAAGCCEEKSGSPFRAIRFSFLLSAIFGNPYLPLKWGQGFAYQDFAWLAFSYDFMPTFIMRPVSD